MKRDLCRLPFSSKSSPLPPLKDRNIPRYNALQRPIERPMLFDTPIEVVFLSSSLKARGMSMSMAFQQRGSGKECTGYPCPIEDRQFPFCHVFIGGCHVHVCLCTDIHPSSCASRVLWVVEKMGPRPRLCHRAEGLTRVHVTCEGITSLFKHPLLH